jgi:hypothetical protein
MRLLLTYLFLFLGFVSQAQICIPNTSSLKFNGNSDYVQINSDTNLEMDSALTVEAWIKPSGFGTNHWDNSIFCKHSWSSGEQGYVLRCGGTGVLSFTFAGFANGSPTSWEDCLSSDSAVQKDVWQHVAGSFDGYRMRLYVNGNQVADSLFVGTMVPGTDYNPMIGRLCDAGQFEGRYFKGKIDEVRVWNRALTQSEIQQRMSVHLDPSQQTGLVGYWRLNDSTGSAVSDASGSGNNANKYGPAWQLDDVPFNNAAAIPSITQSGDLLISSYASAYQWYMDNAEIAGATNQTYLVIQSGAYFVQITDSIGCTAWSDTLQMIPTGIESPGENLLILIANPADRELVIRLGFTSGNARITLTNLSGQVCHESTVPAGTGQFEINVASYPAGKYLLMVETESNSLAKPVAVIH